MSLKDALMKAGFRQTNQENERSRRPKAQDVQKSVVHQEQRNFCEVCDMVHPDVERYKHKNPTITAQWICVACADRHMIDDQYRVTHQSDFAKKGVFRREYGRTRRANEFESITKKPTDKRPPERPADAGKENRSEGGHRDNKKANFNKPKPNFSKKP